MCDLFSKVTLGLISSRNSTSDKIFDKKQDAVIMFSLLYSYQVLK